MKKLILLISLALAGHWMVAQDEAIFMHYTVSPILINPAAAGFQESLQLQVNARAQWTGFEDSPKTYGALLNTPIGRTFGLGLGVLSEKAAQMDRMRLQLNYAFRFRIKERLKIGAGFSTEYQRMVVNNDVTTSNFFQDGDNILDDFLNGRGVFDATVGLYGTLGDDVQYTFAGLTFNNLVRNRLDDIAANDQNGSVLQYYTFNIGHRFPLEGLSVSLEPSLLLRQIRDVPFQMDINLKAGFMDDQLITGLSYRSLGALGILLGTRISAFSLYYSYDVSFQRFQRYNTGSHELTLAFAFQKKEKPIKGN